MKKLIILTWLLICVLGLIGCNQKEQSDHDIPNDKADTHLAFENTEAVNLYTGNLTEKENTVHDNFSIVSSALFVGNYACSEKTYMIEREKDFLMYSMNWAPTGQSVHIGFMNKENNALYLLDDVEGGSAAGTINTVNVPSGEYYVIVFAASDNTEPFSINATCEWTEYVEEIVMGDNGETENETISRID